MAFLVFFFARPLSYSQLLHSLGQISVGNSDTNGFVRVDKVYLILLLFIGTCQLSFANGANTKEMLIIDTILSLSKESLTQNGIQVEYAINVDSEPYAKYLNSITKIPLKDIHFIKKTSNCDMIFYKNGNYILREVSPNSPQKWQLSLYDGKKYFFYKSSKKFGQITREAPDLVLPNYIDFLTRIPQFLNIPKYWKLYQDVIPDSVSTKLEFLPNGEAKISFHNREGGKIDTYFEIYLTQKDSAHFIRKIDMFEGRDNSPNNLSKSILFSNYKYIDKIHKYLPYEIVVEYYTQEGILLLDDKKINLPKMIERSDRLHVNKINLPSLSPKSIELSDEAVIHDFNIGKTIYLKEIFR